MPKLTSDQIFLRALAQRGATSRLEELKQEMASLEKLITSAGEQGQVTLRPSSGKPRRKMSMKARQAHSRRMKAFWAAKRKSKPSASASK